MVVINKYMMLVQLGLAVGLDRKYLFSVTNNACYQLYDNVISDVYGVISLTSCSALCAEESCCSYLFDKASKRCITYSAYAQSTSTGCGWEYAENDLDICRDPISSPSPYAANSCDHGYSYDSTSNTCVGECVSYGSTFGTFEGYLLNGYNNKVISVSSEQACMDACVAETAFVCRTAEHESGTCFLSVDTALTQPGIYVQSSGYILWQRNCA